MFTASAEFYDLVYSTFKDDPPKRRGLRASCAASTRASTVLDVACGTGEHARLLAEQGFAVDGLDLDPAFVRIAALKNPGGRFFTADMRTFHLPYRYDAVLCLFSSIGYLETLDRVREALTCFRAHLAQGGVVLVEPWFAPGGLDASRVARNDGQSGSVRVSRVSRVEIDGRLSRLFFDYDITDERGTRHASEVHVLGLFTIDEMLSAFREAGFDVEHDTAGLTGRGLYVARVAG